MKLFPLILALGSFFPAPLNSAQIVSPEEPMVVTPGLQYLGPSRISTVEFCADSTGVKDWRNMITDEEFAAMEECFLENT